MLNGPRVQRDKETQAFQGTKSTPDAKFTVFPRGQGVKDEWVREGCDAMRESEPEERGEGAREKTKNPHHPWTHEERMSFADKVQKKCTL